MNRTARMYYHPFDDSGQWTSESVDLQVGDRFSTIAPYSEVMVHMNIAGQPIEVEVLSERAAQIYVDGEPFSFPVTLGEAGIYRTASRKTAAQPFDIAAYIYRADIYTPDELIEALIADGVASPGARGMNVEDTLDQIAEANAIDRDDEYSFDSDDFPKIVFRDEYKDYLYALEREREQGYYAKRRTAIHPGGVIRHFFDPVDENGHADYGWLIDKDFTEADWMNHPSGKPGRAAGYVDVNVMGPYNISPAIEASLRSGGGQAFQLFSDDGDLYYTGRWIEGDHGYTPLDDYGAPNAGCTRMTVGNNLPYIGGLREGRAGSKHHAKRRTARRRVAVRYPNVEVTLVGEDGNAFGVLARVQRSLKRAGVAPSEIEEFYAEATSGDYDHLLQTAMKWVSVN